MALSAQQQAVVDFAVTGEGSLNLIARAGCGKSYTLLEVVKAIKSAKPEAEVSLVAYNKAIADELKLKIAEFGWGVSVQAATMHGVGFQTISSYLKSTKGITKMDIDSKKLDKIMDGLVNELIQATKRPGLSTDKWQEIQGKLTICETQRGFVTKAVSLAKQRAFGVIHPADQLECWYKLVEHFNLDQDWDELEMKNSASMIKLCVVVYNRSLDQILEGKLDFDDMVLGPLFYRCKFWPKDFVLVDEAQDLNPARRLLAIRMANSNGRIICVGDPAQAIYGFTGADSDSMDLMKAAMHSHELPLNLTYRCPKAVVAVAQQWVPDFMAHESNPEGSVRSIPFVTFADEDGVKAPDFSDEALGSTDAVLCRNTKPLIELAWSLIKRKVACRVEGRDIGQGLIQMAKRWKVVKLDAFKNRVTAWAEKEVAKLRSKEREDLIQSIEDKADTIVCIIDGLVSEGKRNVSDFETFVTNLFGDTRDGEMQKVLTLSTIHKSKGREWEKVYVLGMNKYQPSKYAKKEWEVQQELNLCYVSVTRSKSELVFIEV